MKSYFYDDPSTATLPTQYELLEKIAVGAMGSIYRALDKRSNQTVAIKTLKEGIDVTEDTILRIRKEAHYLSRLEHPNIVRFIDFIEQNNSLFIITEYIQGQSLRHMIEKELPSLRRRIEIIRDIALALDFVHSENIIHRDIKPGNIMQNTDNQIKILDFGLANLINYKKIFLKNEIVGSLAYMSPEQTGILKKMIDSRSDLYSLGILFYEMMTGTLPFKASEAGEMMHMHIARIPEDPISINPQIPPMISQIILKLIKKDPDDRYQSAFGLAADLGTFLALNETAQNPRSFALGKKDRLRQLHFHSPLIGREKEKVRLTACFEKSLKGEGNALFLIGGAGTGKSKLLSEIKEFSSHENTFVIRTGCDEQIRNLPYQPFMEAIKSILLHTANLPKKELDHAQLYLRDKMTQKCAHLCHSIPQLSDFFSCTKSSSCGTDINIHIFFDSLKTFFLTFSELFPLTLVFEDIHFWDKESLDFLFYLIDNIRPFRIFIALSIKEEELKLNQVLYKTLTQKKAEQNISILQVENLSKQHTEHFVLEFFPLMHDVQQLSALLFEFSQGNPLLIYENLKALLEEGVIYQDNDNWLFERSKLNTDLLSLSLADKLLLRLDKLPKNTLEVLILASLIGMDFSLPLLLSLISSSSLNIPGHQAYDSLEEAIKAGVIIERFNESLNRVYSFSSQKIKELLSQKPPEQEKRKLTLFIAQTMESSYGGADRIYKLAHYYRQTTHVEKSYLYNKQAGLMAADYFSYTMALEFLNTAYNLLKDQEMTGNIKEERVNLGLSIFEINFQLSVYAPMIPLLLEILPLAMELHDQDALCHIYVSLGKCHFLMGEQSKAIPYYKKVIPIAESLKLKSLLAIPYAAIGRVVAFSGFHKDAIHYLSHSLKYFSEKDTVHEIYHLDKLFSLGVLGIAYAELRQKDAAREVLLQLEPFREQNQNQLYEMYVLFYQGYISVLLGDMEKGRLLGQKCQKIAKELGIKIIEMFSLFYLSLVLSAEGNHKDAIANLQLIIKTGQEHNILPGFYAVFFYLAEINIRENNKNAALLHLEKGLEYAREAHQEYVSQWHSRLSALCELISLKPDPQRALKLIQDALKQTESLGALYQFHHAQNLLVKSIILEKLNLQEGSLCFQEALSVLKIIDLPFFIIKAQELRDKFLSSQSLSFSDYSHSADSYTDFSYARQLKYLLKLSEQLSQLLDMQTLLDKILFLAMEVSGAERGILFLTPENSPANLSPDDLLIMSYRSFRENNANPAVVTAYAKSILAKTLSSKKGQLIGNAPEEMKMDPAIASCQIKSIITAPLVTSGKLLGVIYLDNTQIKGLFNTEYFELLEAFAVESAISIDNVRLYQTVANKARIEQEIQIAQDIQNSIIPDVQDKGNYLLSAYMRPADEIGGDYYDLFMDLEPYFGVFGDVSGHGLLAGLIMMMAEVVFNAYMQDENLRHGSLSSLYQKINLTLYKNIHERLHKKSKIGFQYSSIYMTFSLFRFDRQGNFELFGSDPARPFICRAEDGSIESIPSSGFLLGITPDASGDETPYRFSLREDDLLIFYSDGITESKSQPRKIRRERQSKQELFMYGTKRLHDLVRENRHLPPAELTKLIIQSADDWMHAQDDDMSLLIIKKTGKEKAI